MRKRTVLLVALTTFAICEGQAQAQPKALYPVSMKVTAQPLQKDGHQRLEITLTIERGWYIYANPVGNELLEPNGLQLKIQGKQLPRSISFRYPRGEFVKDKVIGDYRIHKGKVIVIADLFRNQGEAAQLEIQAWQRPINPEKGVCIRSRLLRGTFP
jgi:hypothetical protein